mgnify:CR=1 FL=1
MQPAYYENLEEIQKKLWSMLDDAVVNRSSPFRIPVFICADQNDIDGRIVVLRKSDRNSNVLQFHTDLRSPKVDILKKNNNASLVFYDKEEKIQLRVKVTCEINNKNSIADESWKKSIENYITNPSLRKEHGLKARERVESMYSVQANESVYLEVIEKVIEG